MANAKLHSKKETVNPFVPVEEHPYKVPENWCWVRLGNVVTLKRGASPRPIKQFITDREDGINWIKIGDTDNGKYITNIKEKIIRQGADKSVFVKKGTLLLSNSMSFGRPYILNVEGCIHDGWLALIPSACVGKEFLYYALLASKWYFEQVAVGTAVRNLNSDRVANTPVPLPSLSEQQRIVDRIESLFAKLDEAKEKVQAVVDSFELRKSAILHKAFTGGLTAKWREEHGLRMESWEQRNLQSVCSMEITDGTHKTPTYCDAEVGIPFISAKDVTTGSICWDNIKYIIPELHRELYKRLAPQVGDVLLAKNGTTGIAAIVEEDKIFDIYVTLAVLRPDKNVVLPRYLLNIVNSPICKRQFDEHLTGIGVPNLHLRDIKAVVIPVPSLDEQQEMIKLIDKLMRNEQQAQKAAHAVLDQIDTMKNAILARAFRGELGTNDPDEEAAAELVKKLFVENQ